MWMVLLALLVVLPGCMGAIYAALSDPADLVRLPEPILVEATRNFLPSFKVEYTASYTIYDRSKWQCDYRVNTTGYGCCNTDPVGTRDWKYCVVTDENLNPFGFLELGRNVTFTWSNGKQVDLFRRVATR